MLSQTAQYALRAIVYIAEFGTDEPVLARNIAHDLGIPKQYLSSILRDAVRAGLLSSTRGKGGGFQLSRSKGRIRLLDVFKPYDDVPPRTACPLGRPRCNDDDPCVFHDYWKPVSAAYRAMLEETTLDDVLSAAPAKRKKGRRRKK